MTNEATNTTATTGTTGNTLGRGFILRSLGTSIVTAAVALSAGVGAGDFVWSGPLESAFEVTSLEPLPETVALLEQIRVRAEAREAESEGGMTAIAGSDL